MKFLFCLVFSITIAMIPTIVYAGQGCCSWHGGQDYCDEEVGKWVCKDGSYSPSCKCGNTIAYSKVENEDNNHPILENVVAIAFFSPLSFSIMLFIYILLHNKIKSKINQWYDNLSEKKQKICNILSVIFILILTIIIIKFWI